MNVKLPHLPVALIVLDGWGHRTDATHNAVAAAKKPFFDSLWRDCPHSLLEASGLAVGLPPGQMGNSEVGHTTIGAGAILDTDLVRIDKSANAGEFVKNPTMIALFDYIKGQTLYPTLPTLHVIGLVSDGGVHSHENHLHAFLDAAKKTGVQKIAIHVITDGRDTAPQSAAGYMKKLTAKIAKLDPTGQHIFIATISGRYYAMDRDKNWDRMALAEAAIFDGGGTSASVRTKLGAVEYLEKEYAGGAKDELLPPVVLRAAPLLPHDGVFVFNFRADRMRMLAERLSLKKDIHIAAMTEFSPEFPFPIAFPLKIVEATLAEQVANAGMSQAHIAETEKFPHATYFLNGGREKPHVGERHIMLASRKDVKTHDQAPEMRAEAIADKAIEEIAAGTNFIFINFANPDMVGHTANVPAIITAIETVDAQLKRVINALEKVGGQAIIIADHGNAEVNIDPETGAPHTAHTTNRVPCILAGDLGKAKHKLSNGGLADVAPTILSLLGLKQPAAMTGKNLL
jgi:2,3-bisphosphoglycerate-independent phosphoglycerate mutase